MKHKTKSHSNQHPNSANDNSLDRVVFGFVGSTLLLTLSSAFALTLPNSIATDTPGTAFGTATSRAKVSVAASCSMTATVNTEHTAVIPNGIYAGGSGSQYYPNGIGQTTIKTFCNDPDGYAVYAVGFTEDTMGNTYLKSNLTDDQNIITGTATGPSGGQDVSNWAMKLSSVNVGDYTPSILSDDDGSYANYHKVPGTYTKVAKFTGATDFTVGSSITTTYAAYISGTQPAGTYEGQVKYSLVHPSGAAAPDADYMQTVANWGSSLAVGEEKQVTDNRDGKAYTVARLCTNYSGDNCTESQLWMTQNLDLEIGGNDKDGNPIVLDSTNTNITSAGPNPTAEGYTTDATTGVITWTPYSTVTTPATNTGWASGTNEGTVSGWTNRHTIPYYMEGGDHYVYDGAIYNSLNDPTTGCTKYHTEAECMHYHVGNYYNFTAAVASNNTSTASSSYYDDQHYVMPNSICPKGWRLPKGLTKDSSNNVAMSEFNKLFKAQGVTGNVGRAADGAATTNGIDLYGGTNVTYSDSGWSKINTTGVNGDPLYFARSGYVWDSTLYSFGYGGAYWSSTLQSGTDAYFLNFSSGDLYPAYSNGRGLGFLVRCVAGDAESNYMQDMNSTRLAKLMPSTGSSTVLYDSRDNQSYTIAKLADGHYWMVDNLNLNNVSQDLTSQNTNLSTTISAATFNAWDRTISHNAYSYTDPKFSPVSGTDSISGTAYGTLYNYCAASANTYCMESNSGSGDAQYDICPAGWRLPFEGEFSSIYNNYDTVAKLRAPLSSGGAAFAYAGLFGDGALEQ